MSIVSSVGIIYVPRKSSFSSRASRVLTVCCAVSLTAENALSPGTRSSCRYAAPRSRIFLTRLKPFASGMSGGMFSRIPSTSLVARTHNEGYVSFKIFRNGNRHGRLAHLTILLCEMPGTGPRCCSKFDRTNRLVMSMLTVWASWPCEGSGNLPSPPLQRSSGARLSMTVCIRIMPDVRVSSAGRCVMSILTCSQIIMTSMRLLRPVMYSSSSLVQIATALEPSMVKPSSGQGAARSLSGTARGLVVSSCMARDLDGRKLMWTSPRSSAALLCTSAGLIRHGIEPAPVRDATWTLTAATWS